MKESFRIAFHVNASPEQVYDHWLDSRGHALITGGEANISNIEGEPFTCWDAYISGKNLKLIPKKYIEQAWRTTEFEPEDESSVLEITLHDSNGGCRIELYHHNIPAGQLQYEQGWRDHYQTPMVSYFSSMKK